MELVKDIVTASFISLAFATLLVKCDKAYGYPENVRLGYQTCNSCHVSPGGGGNLTQYGRGFAEELATFHQENSGNFLFNLTPAPPNWFLIGGDTRYLDYRTVTANEAFLMQKDVEVALKASKEMTFDASVGTYYKEDGYHSRRHYAMWTPNDNVAVRVGRFMPVYGLMIQDHTAAIKAPLGYNEGQETYNVEASYRDKFSEIFLTASYGDGTTFKSDSPDPMVSLQNNRYTARASWFANSKFTLGGSYSLKFDAPHLFEQTMGPYAMIALSPHFYILTEADHHITPNFDVEYTEVGYEVYQGVHLQATHEYEQASVWGLGLQVFPVSHTEIDGKVKYDSHTGDVSSELLLHIYW